MTLYAGNQRHVQGAQQRRYRPIHWRLRAVRNVVDDESEAFGQEDDEDDEYDDGYGYDDED